MLMSPHSQNPSYAPVKTSSFKWNKNSASSASNYSLLLAFLSLSPQTPHPFSYKCSTYLFLSALPPQITPSLHYALVVTNM